MNKKTLLASEIDDCSICPIEEECHRSCREGWEGPCTSWNGDEEIYEGWLEEQFFLAEERYENQLKEERSWRAKHNAQIRKEYAHLNDKVKKIAECHNSQELISNVLNACPNYIDVYFKSNCNSEAVSFLSNVFANRLKIFSKC